MSPKATQNKTSGPGAGILLSAFPRGHTTACHRIGKLLHDVGKTQPLDAAHRQAVR